MHVHTRPLVPTCSVGNTCNKYGHLPFGVMPLSYVAGFKANFKSLQQLVLIGGPDDGVITPWQSRSVACWPIAELS